MAQTSQNDGMIFTLALSYGSRMEIIDAVKRLTDAVQRGELHPEEITPTLFSSYLVYRRAARPRPLDSDWRRATIEQFPAMANVLY